MKKLLIIFLAVIFGLNFAGLNVYSKTSSDSEKYKFEEYEDGNENGSEDGYNYGNNEEENTKIDKKSKKQKKQKNQAVVKEVEPAVNDGSLEVHDDAPVWAEYVAPKYRNPRTDFSRGSSIAELAVGIVLTDLIITSPIGIPMIIHGTTKVKMVSYANRKNIFDAEIPRAQLIQDDEERHAQYQEILKRCHLKESTRKHYLKKAQKAQEKASKLKEN